MKRLKLLRRNSEKAKPKEPVKVSWQALARAKGISTAPTQRRNPFVLPEFPKSAMPDKSNQMAMDDNSAWAGGLWGSTAWSPWASSIGAVFAEGLAFPGYTFLAEQAQRPEYRKFAEIIGTEMTRKWIKLQSVSTKNKSAKDYQKIDVRGGGAELKPQMQAIRDKRHMNGSSIQDRSEDDGKAEKIKELEDAIDKFKLKDRFQKCAELDSLFGRAHLYIDTYDAAGRSNTDNREELQTSIGDGRNATSKSKVGQGMLRGFRTIEPVWCYPLNYDSSNPLRDSWYEPDTWFVMNQPLHASRCLKFVGREVPDLLKPAYAFGGLSMTQMATPYVNNWLRTRQSVADIIHAFSVMVLMTDLGEDLMAGGQQLFDRVDFFNAFRDNKGLMLVNKDSEDFKNISAPLGSLDALQAQSQEQMCSVASIPVVKFLGIQPSGLNASSEGEIRTFYDWIHAFQEKFFRNNLTKCIDFVQLHLWGAVDEDIVFDFEPLWALDEKAMAEVQKIETDIDSSRIADGVLAPVEVRKRIAADEDSAYSSIDVEDVPDLKQEEEEGLIPGAGHGKGGKGGSSNGETGESGFGDGDDEEAIDTESEFEGNNYELAEQALKHQARKRGERERAGGVHRSINEGTRGTRDLGQRSVGELDSPEPGGEAQGLEVAGVSQSQRNKTIAAAALVRQARRGKSDPPPQKDVDEDPFDDDDDDWQDDLDDNDYLWTMDVAGQDDASGSWEESKHPRDAQGKFTAYNVGGNLKKSLEEHGFKKTKSSSTGKKKFTDNDGNTIVAEPPTHGGMQTSKWTLYPADGSAKIEGETGKNLTKHFADKLKGQPKAVQAAVKELAQPLSSFPETKAGGVTPLSELDKEGVANAKWELEQSIKGTDPANNLQLFNQFQTNKNYKELLNKYGLTAIGGKNLLNNAAVVAKKKGGGEEEPKSTGSFWIMTSQKHAQIGHDLVEAIEEINQPGYSLEEIKTNQDIDDLKYEGGGKLLKIMNDYGISTSEALYLVNNQKALKDAEKAAKEQVGTGKAGEGLTEQGQKKLKDMINALGPGLGKFNEASGTIEYLKNTNPAFAKAVEGLTNSQINKMLAPAVEEFNKATEDLGKLKDVAANVKSNIKSALTKELGLNEEEFKNPSDFDDAMKYNSSFKAAAEYYMNEHNLNPLQMLSILKNPDIKSTMGSKVEQAKVIETQEASSSPSTNNALLGAKLYENGFKPGKGFFQKGESYVKLGPDGTWLSIKPGTSPKEGKGIEDLEKLITTGAKGPSVKSNHGATIGSWNAPAGHVSPPLDMSKLKKVGGKLGSNEGGTYEDESGKKYYIKKGQTKKHVQNEMAAASLYNLAGSNTLKYKPVEGGDHIASEWQEFDKNNAKNLSANEKKEVQKDFAVHAWLSNWDAAGLDFDNQSFANGKAYTNDLGGALEYRAQGAEKGKDFGDTVGEWDTLRDDKTNPQNANLFKGMTDQQLKDSAQKVLDISDDSIQKAISDAGLPAALAEKLIKRKKDIAKKAGIVKPPQTSTEAHAMIQDLAKYAKKPDASQKSAIQGYTGSGYHSMNSSLRQGGDLTGQSKVLQDYLTNQTFDEDVTLYRKVGGEYAQTLKSLMYPGARFEDKGFSSTSVHPGTWHGDIHFTIQVPKGSKGASVGHISSHQSEHEVILPATSRFEVLDIQKKSGVHHVKVKLMTEHL